MVGREKSEYEKEEIRKSKSDWNTKIMGVKNTINGAIQLAIRNRREGKGGWHRETRTA